MAFRFKSDYKTPAMPQIAAGVQGGNPVARAKLAAQLNPGIASALDKGVNALVQGNKDALEREHKNALLEMRKAEKSRSDEKWEYEKRNLDLAYNQKKKAIDMLGKMQDGGAWKPGQFAQPGASKGMVGESASGQTGELSGYEVSAADAANNYAHFDHMARVAKAAGDPLAAAQAQAQANKWKMKAESYYTIAEAEGKARVEKMKASNKKLGTEAGEQYSKYHQDTGAVDDFISSVERKILGRSDEELGGGGNIAAFQQWTGIGGGETLDKYSDMDLLKSQSFRMAFESLKGGGQITELESEKAQTSFDLATREGLSPKKRRQHAKDAIYHLKKARNLKWKFLSKNTPGFKEENPNIPHPNLKEPDHWKTERGELNTEGIDQYRNK